MKEINESFSHLLAMVVYKICFSELWGHLIMSSFILWWKRM